MLPENRTTTHPGKVLKEEFLEPLGITQLAFAQHIGVPLQRVHEVVRGKRSVTPRNGLAVLPGPGHNSPVLDEPARGL